MKRRHARERWYERPAIRGRRHILAPAAAVSIVAALVLIGVTVSGAVLHRTPSKVAPTTTTSTTKPPPPLIPTGSILPGSAPPTLTPQSPGLILASTPFDLPDPFLLAVAGRYYLYVGTAFGEPRHENIPMVSGTVGHWTKPVDALPVLPKWAVPTWNGGSLWAPAVFRFGHKYLMYYSATFRIHPTPQHCIGLAVSDNPAGPYTPTSSKPFICDLSRGGDIDAQVFVDKAGPDGPANPYYLLWKSDNNSQKHDGVTSIWASALSNDGMHLVGEALRIYWPVVPWEQHLVEAPAMVTSPNGSLWLFYSAGAGFFKADYAIGVVSCVSPLGPCHDVSDRPILTHNQQGIAPGEETAYTAGDGSTWIIYNPWPTGIGDFGLFLRPAMAVRIGWKTNGPYIAEAGSFPPAA